MVAIIDTNALTLRLGKKMYPAEEAAVINSARVN